MAKLTLYDRHHVNNAEIDREWEREREQLTAVTKALRTTAIKLK